MSNVAKITIAGRAGSDANQQFTQSGIPLCDFSVAVNNRDNSTTWYKVTVWRKYAEVIAPLVKKGALVTVIGDFQPRSYTNKQGQPGTSFDITAEVVIVAGQAGQSDERSTPPPSSLDEIPF